MKMFQKLAPADRPHKEKGEGKRLAIAMAASAIAIALAAPPLAYADEWISLPESEETPRRLSSRRLSPGREDVPSCCSMLPVDQKEMTVHICGLGLWQQKKDPHGVYQWTQISAEPKPEMVPIPGHPGLFLFPGHTGIWSNNKTRVSPTTDLRSLPYVTAVGSDSLTLVSIDFINCAKEGTLLTGPSYVFGVSKVQYIGWRAVLISTPNSRLSKYQIRADYIAPDGSSVGSVDDIQTVNRAQQRLVFTGRIGNKAGDAFLSGQYTVNFYLNGQYFAQRKFRIVGDAGIPYSGGGSSGGSALGASTTSAIGLDTPTLATGTVEGIQGHHSVGMELRLRPQPNGFLHGELVMHLPGYDPIPIEGFVRGSHVQFQVPHGAETYYFEGERRSDVLSGTFESTPTGERGTWSTRAD